MGILIGATIHDVAQVVGAGFAVSTDAGEVATYVKLLRVALLPVVVIALALATSRSRTSSAPPWPLFTVAFAAILLANSFGLISDILQTGMVDVSRWLLAAAIAALGVKTSLQAMFSLGPSHMLVVVIETAFLAALAVGIITFI